MRKHGKLILAGLTASLLMALAVSGTASARTFSLSNRNLRVVWTSLEFTNTGGLGTMRCPVTIEGSFHSATISKVEKALIGHISRAAASEASCSGGGITIHRESLPWHITYNGFRGILPRINSFRLLFNLPLFQINFSGFGTCTANTEANHEIRAEAILNASGEIENLSPDPTPQIPTNAGCLVAEVMLRAPAGDGRVTLLGTTTRIRITLI
jgi:hypothetical protein